METPAALWRWTGGKTCGEQHCWNTRDHFSSFGGPGGYSAEVRLPAAPLREKKKKKPNNSAEDFCQVTL